MSATQTTPGTPHRDPHPAARRVALIGNPNTGKTSLFNRVAGARHQTANFPGTTQEYRVGRARGEHDRPIELIDLPGVYTLETGQSEARVCRDALEGNALGGRPPDAVCVVVDATRVTRGLRLLAEIAKSGAPVVVALNMHDLAHKRGVVVRAEEIAEELGCPVVPTSARTGAGVPALIAAFADAAPVNAEGDAWAWAERVGSSARDAAAPASSHAMTERLDRVLMHPVSGTLVFAIVMGAIFWTIFKLAGVPMDLVDAVFARLSGWASSVLPAGAVSELLSEGIIGGVGATVIFLPQIVILFFLISLLEGTGYLARAALLMDRLFRPFGLPGQSFVPMLSAHACAIPAVMSCRGVPGRQERLATILVAPFLSCSARIPVYVLLTGLLFADRPGLAAVAFAGCYVLGAIAALFTALLFRRTILRGPGRPMAIDLPDYRRPSVRSALLTTYDRAMSFLKKAGTVIVAMMVVLWWAGEYPHAEPPAEVVELRAQAASVEGEPAEALIAEADEFEARHAGRSTFLGRAGRTVQPVFAPLGYDWQITVGVLGSFAAREVFVSTLSVVVAGSDDAEDEGVLDRLRTARRDDGSVMLSPATSWSLLVFYVLAMQCLPTLAVTAREAGGWKWAMLQLGWMSLLAYGAALVTHQALTATGMA
ncbi:MAG: ferrous iron transporter B [Phycisphaerales bacterium]